MQRTPLNISNPKRRLDMEDLENNSNIVLQQDQQNSIINVNTSGLNNSSLNGSAAKRLNLSNQNDSFNRMGAINKFEAHMFEAEVKSNIIKIATLEQELKSEYNERVKLELEFNSYKEKQASEFQQLKESKQQLEQALKSSKTNESLLNSEMDHLRKKIESYEGVKLVDKDKELSTVKKEFEDLNAEKNELKTSLEKSINDMKFDLESKNNEISNLEAQIGSLNEKILNMGDLNKKLDELRKENCLLQNRNKDLELEVSNQKDNSQQITDYMTQSNKIADLERENRKLKSEIDFLKANQEKSHLYQEELRSKTMQVERFEAKIVSLELENSNLKESIENLKEQNQHVQPSDTAEKLKQVISELDDEISKQREKSKHLDGEIKQLKLEKSDKEEKIDELQKRVARLNTERNGYKNIIDFYDAQKSEPDGLAKSLYKRIDEMEIVLNEYKKAIHDSNELKLCNNSSFQLENTTNGKSVEIQVNLNAEIYSFYENKIELLNKEVEHLRNKQQSINTEMTSKCFGGLNETLDLINAKNNIGNDGQAYKVLALEMEIKNLTMKHERYVEKLTQEFSKKSLEIIRSIKNLVGYKVKFNDDKTIRLTNLIDGKHSLLFRINEDYSLSLMNVDSARIYSDFVDLYLTKYNSVLAYLNAINFDLMGLKLEVVSK